MNKSNKGYSFESHIVDVMRKKGMYAQRTAGSHGPYDVIAHDDKNFYLIKARDHTKKSSIELDMKKIRMFKAPLTVTKKQLWVKEKGEVKIISISDKGGSERDFLQKGKEDKALSSKVQEVRETKADKT